VPDPLPPPADTLWSSGDVHMVVTARRLHMSSPDRLTLGAVYHAMRSGLGDAGRVRVTVEFRERTTAVRAFSGATAEPVEVGSVVLGAHLDYADGGLQRAEISLRGSRPTQRVLVQRQGRAYGYSVDGERWGRFSVRPRIFDLPQFETEIGRIAVHDVRIDQAVKIPKLEQALDVDLDREGFAQLLRVFSADVGDETGGLSLGAFSVSLEAADDVSLLYWWALTGLGGAPTSAEEGPRALKISCSVSIRLAAAGAQDLPKLTWDRELPAVANVDEVWSLLRRRDRGS
jgi:hypothetical protein